MKQQPLVTWISLIGTALAIFLIMAVFMVNRVNVVEVSPESNRDRILYGSYIDIYLDNGSSSGGLTYESAHEIYSNLKGIEILSFIETWNTTAEINVPGQQPFDVEVKGVDANFWKIYDFHFSQGTPFDSTAVDAGAHYAVITEDTAVRLFGKGENVVGREIQIDIVPYIITGVVNNANPLMSNSYAQVYRPVKLKDSDPGWIAYLGELGTVMLRHDNVTRDDIAKEVQARYAAFNNRLQKEGMQAIYHGT
ncbi:MAG: ABC transporter permease, partial [Muribaculaceae bacterium]|nr:ABC transporter permease [Muribaculaceae bacterium]